MFQKALLHYPEDKLHTTSSQNAYSLLEQLNEGAVVSDAQGQIRLANQQISNLLGYSKSELLKCNWSDLLVESSYYEYLITNKLQPGKAFRSILQLVTKASYFITVEIRIQQLPSGEYLTYVYEDQVSEIVNLDPVQQSKVGEQYVRLNDQIPCGVIIIKVLANGEMKIQYANDGVFILTGITIESLYREPQHWFSRVHPHDRTPLLNTLHNINPNIVIHNNTFRFLHPQKGDIWLEAHSRNQSHANGDITWFIMFRDITPYKRIEEQLRVQAGVLNTIADAVFMVDMTFTITMWNRGAEKLYGWSADEMIGQVIEPYESSRFDSTIVDGEFHQVLDSLYEQGTWQGEMLQTDKTGRRIPILSSFTLLRDATGKKKGFIAVNRDISAQKAAEQRQRQIEEELQHAKHMESIGRLAGGVAHNFNNLLTVVQGYADLIQMQIPADDPVQQDVEQIILASQRAALITRHLLAIGRKQMLTPMVFDINQLIETVHTLLERVLGKQFTFTLLLDPNLKPVLADAGQIEEMFTNMILNARDAMPNGGDILIASHMARPSEVKKSHLPVGDYIKVTVSDTGSGMEPEILRHIFEPFFTTKSSEQGSGLGLATVYGSIKQSNGDIQVASTPGVGTTFTIYLPCGDPEQHLSLLPVQVHTNEALGGNETVLLLENNQQVRQLIQETLQVKGYTILEANTPQEAAHVIHSYPHQIDLLITTVALAHNLDVSLDLLLKQQWKQAKVIVISGHSDDVVRNAGLSEETVFLAKPFTAHSLAMKVREVLDS